MGDVGGGKVCNRGSFSCSRDRMSGQNKLNSGVGGRRGQLVDRRQTIGWGGLPDV